VCLQANAPPPCRAVLTRPFFPLVAPPLLLLAPAAPPPPKKKRKTQKQEWHQEALDNLRAAMARTHLMCATVMDTLGPEILVINRCVVSSKRATTSESKTRPPCGEEPIPLLFLAHASARDEK
jgi:hypothetical protein